MDAGILVRFGRKRFAVVKGSRVRAVSVRTRTAASLKGGGAVSGGMGRADCGHTSFRDQ